MLQHLILAAWLVLFAPTGTIAHAGDAVGEEMSAGEFLIPLALILDESQRARLIELVAADDEAGAVAQRAVAAARPALERPPQPLAVIHYEGLVHTDPRRVSTVESLDQMGDIAKLLRAWQVTGDDRLAAHLRELIAAWTQTYVITGNDVNENKFCPLLMAYASLRDTFDAESRRNADAWVTDLGEVHFAQSQNQGGVSNRYAKHLRITALCAKISDQPEWQAAARDGAKRMIEYGLRPDGSSHDLEQRDSLGYHGSAVKALIEMSFLIDAAPGEVSLYDWVAPSGASIRRSVDYVRPYATGEITREEWRNTQVELDRQRAAAGLAEYQPGRLYQPRQAIGLMESASLYDPSLRPLVSKLTTSDAKRYPTWMTMMSAVWNPTK